MYKRQTLYVAENQLQNIAPIADLSKIWSLDVSGNQLKDLSAVKKLGWLTSLDIVGNEIDSLEPLSELRDLDMLIMSKNKVADLQPLVDMCRKDAEDDRRFAPYLEVYLGGNPLEKKKLASQTKELKSFGVDVHNK